MGPSRTDSTLVAPGADALFAAEPTDGEPDTLMGREPCGAEVDGAPMPHDPAAAFAADVARVELLTRDEEEALGWQIAAQRDRIRRLLRGRRRLVAAALRNVGRGVVHPDADFREREALTILAYAKRRAAAPAGGAGSDRPALRRFVDRLECELDAYRTLRDRMMTANVRLVMSLARRYHHPTLSFLDLVQEGVLGLMRAVEKYQPSRQIKFSTYAVWWVWQQIARAADCQGALIRTPVHWNQLRRKLGRLGRDAGSVELDLTPERVAEMTQPLQCLSLATPLGRDDERTLSDTLAADPAEGPEQSMVETNLGERLASALCALPDREAQIVSLRFGMSGRRAQTLEEIGQRFGVSRERIRQIEARALGRMRAICNTQGLAELLG